MVCGLSGSADVALLGLQCSTHVMLAVHLMLVGFGLPHWSGVEGRGAP